MFPLIRNAVLVIFLFSSIVVARAQASVTVVWDPNPEPQVVGYRVYYGLASRSYTGMFDAGDMTEVVVNGLQAGKKYFFAVTAYDADGLESPFSSEVVGLLAAPITSSFWYDFRVHGVLREAASPLSSSSAYWWLRSGGFMYLSNYPGITNGVGTTVMGTDEPRIFQLLLRDKREYAAAEVFIMKMADNLSNPTHRHAHNAMTLYLRYVDEKNYYFVSIRNDGYITIRKCVNGVFYTLFQKKLLGGTWSKDTNPSLIPTNVWFGLRAILRENAIGDPEITFLVDHGRTGTWTPVGPTIVDKGPDVVGAGYTGIRLDYMDAYFDDYRVSVPLPTDAPAPAPQHRPSDSSDDELFEPPAPIFTVQIMKLNAVSAPEIRIRGPVGRSFVLERSSNLETWEVVYTGTIDSWSNFVFHDETAPPDRATYRVVTAD